MRSSNRFQELGFERCRSRSAKRRASTPGSNPYDCVVLSDTTEDAQRQQDAVFRAMGAERRVAAAFEMSEAAFEIARTGIRARHPDYSNSQIRLAEIRVRLGDDLFRAAFPGQPLLPA